MALDAAITRSHKERAPELSESEYFELFVAEHLLKDYGLSDDEIESGLVGGFDEGGVDGVYFFVNRQLVLDDSEIMAKAVNRASLVFIQATRESGFNSVRVDKLSHLTEDFLDLSRSQSQLLGTYNSEVLEVMERFKIQYVTFFEMPHDFTVSYFYVSKGPTRTINTAVRKASERVLAKAEKLFPDANINFDFVGDAELLQLVRSRPQRQFDLPFTDAFLNPKDQDAFVCLVPIADYCKFITEEDGTQREWLYESNVRHWQGDNRVNEGITATLRDGVSGEDFWWLNNGITILATKVAPKGRRALIVEDPQIVNGLQTSRAIFDYFKNRGAYEGDDRNVLIRVIKPAKPESQLRIIRATNSQTPVAEFQLHSLDEIHREIETVMLHYGLFYDRQKGLYKSLGRPKAKIVGQIPLAQSVMAILLQEPNEARARPQTVLKNNYGGVFCEQYPLTLYVKCTLISNRVEMFLRASSLELSRQDRTNLRWYVAMEYVKSLTGSRRPTAKEIADLTVPDDDLKLADAYDTVKGEYDRLGATDVVAKGSDLIESLNRND